MRRNQRDYGLTIAKNIEVTEIVSSKRFITAYILQALMVIFLCLSTIYCFVSGLNIEVNVLGLNLRVIAFTIGLFVMFLFKPYIKFTLPTVFFMFLLMVYLWWGYIQASFTCVANSFIELYNHYYVNTIEEFSYQALGDQISNNTIIYFYSFILTAFLCCMVLYGKSVFLYLVITIPVAMLPLLVGYMPSFLPYVCYVAGTIGIFGAFISEKLGQMPKRVKGVTYKDPLLQVGWSKVAVQYISVATVLVVAILAYKAYSPERYEEEFKAEEIISSAKARFDNILSGDLFEDTIFGDWFSQKRISGGGINKGILNNVGELNFDHEVALKVLTERKENPGPCYLKAYVGEQYSTNQWKELSEEDQEKLNQVESGFTLSYNGESMTSTMVKLLNDSPYDLNHYRMNTMKVEIEGADKDSLYMPYNTISDISNDKGSLRTDQTEYEYMDFALSNESGSPLSENYRKIDALNVLKMNLINSAIFEKYYQVEMKTNWEQQIAIKDRETLSEELSPYGVGITNNIQNYLTVPLSEVYTGELPYLFFEQPAFIGSNLPVYLDKFDFVLNVGNAISQFNQYAIEENAYFNFVREAYTKLPEEGLERVKQLVAGHVVTVTPTVLDGKPYTDLQQLGGLKSVLDTYKKHLNLLDTGDSMQNIRDDENSIQTKYYEAIEYVRNYLAQNTSYSLKPGLAPRGEDYVDYFLFENKKGFCVHYATAATVMLRAMGVPARYVEGYVITSDQYEGLKPEDKKSNWENEGRTDAEQESVDMVKINVMDENAHAWVEVYLPGLGWQPVEMTAPYITDSNIKIPSVNVDPNANLKPTPSATITPSSTPTVSPSVSPTVSPSPTMNPSESDDSSIIKEDGFFGGLRYWYHGLSSSVRNIIKSVLVLLLLLILFIGGVYIRCLIIRRMRAKKRHLLTNSQWVIYENIRLSKVLGQNKVSYQTKEHYKEFVSQLCNKFDFVDEQQAQSYYGILLKARFDQNEISETDVQECQEFYDNYIKGLYKQLGKFRKWFYQKRWVL